MEARHGESKISIEMRVGLRPRAGPARYVAVADIVRGTGEPFE